MKTITAREFRSFEYKTFASVAEAVETRIQQHMTLIPGCRTTPDRVSFEDGCGYISLEWDRSFSVGASLMLSKRTEYVTVEGGKDDEVHQIASIKIEVNWSSSSRSPAKARAAAALYAQVVDLACDLEALVEGEWFVKTMSKKIG